MFYQSYWKSCSRYSVFTLLSNYGIFMTLTTELKRDVVLCKCECVIQSAQTTFSSMSRELKQYWVSFIVLYSSNIKYDLERLIHFSWTLLPYKSFSVFTWSPYKFLFYLYITIVMIILFALFIFPVTYFIFSSFVMEI